ncbi:MAG TPA: acetate/propionate family kinase [Gemmatimonadaceae bacterium]
MYILALNTGSSSLKYAVYDATGTQPDTLELLRSGGVDGIGSDRSRVRLDSDRGPHVTEMPVPDQTAALELITDDLHCEHLWSGLAAVGHRIVHGGSLYREPVCITTSVRDALEALIPLAPEHLRDELHAVDALANRAPHLTQVACFDTAFHRDLPLEARWYGLPRALADDGVIRYGFHGLSYEYIVRELRRQGALGMRTIIAHLGNGASMAAIRDGRSIDTSMGFTPRGGFVMSTRSGDLDPGILLYLLRERSLSLDEVDAMVTTSGGLLGLSGTSADMRDLLARSSTDEHAAQAIAVFCYQVRKFVGAYVAALGGLDTLVFTGGIGEHAAEVRSRICDGLACIGVRIDTSANTANAAVISPGGAPVTIHVMPTNEERMIASHTAHVLQHAVPGEDHDGSH